MSTFHFLDAKPDHTLLTLRRIRDDKARKVADHLLGEHALDGVLSDLVLAYAEARLDYVEYDRARTEAHLKATGGGPDGA